MSDHALLKVVDLKKHFPVGGGKKVHALDGVSFDLGSRETLAVVGESGCGKSTLARLLLGLVPSTAGQIVLDGQEIDAARPAKLGSIRKRIQIVFQDPFGSLNPRQRVRDALAEPMKNFGLVRRADQLDQKLKRLLDLVGLPQSALDRLPHEFSGGQRQRICIARALASEADIVVCDEAVSALDVSVKAQIINLLADIQEETGVSFVFISHDLAIVENIAHRIAVMYLGQIIEIGDKRSLFRNPFHPYTQALLSAVPVADPHAPRADPVKGDLPSPIDPPQGCRFHTRCPFAFERCRTETPKLRPTAAALYSACHLENAPPFQLPNRISEVNQ